MDIANKGQAKKAAEKMTLNSFYGHALIQLFSSCLPRYDDHKVHDVPHVSQVTARMEDKALCQNLEAGLNRKDPQEIGLCGFLVQKK